MHKKLVYDTIQGEIDSRIGEIQKALQNQKESLSSVSESTAGDKHNTSRAMMHIEVEKLSKQLSQLLQLKKLLLKVNPSKETKAVTLGSLVETNNGYLFIAVPLGKITIAQKSLMAISLASPIGQALQGKIAGDSFSFNNQDWKIKNVV